MYEYKGTTNKDLILSPTQQIPKRRLTSFAPPSHPLRQNPRPIIHQRNHMPIPLILHQQIHKLPRFHFRGNLTKDKGGTELSLNVESHPNPGGSIVGIGVFRVFDEVPPSLAMAAVIPSVALNRTAEAALDQWIVRDLGRGGGEDGVGGEFGGD